jgi:hypothetical protein
MVFRPAGGFSNEPVDPLKHGHAWIAFPNLKSGITRALSLFELHDFLEKIRTAL